MACTVSFSGCQTYRFANCSHNVFMTYFSFSGCILNATALQNNFFCYHLCWFPFNSNKRRLAYILGKRMPLFWQFICRVSYANRKTETIYLCYISCWRLLIWTSLRKLAVNFVITAEKRNLANFRNISNQQSESVMSMILSGREVLFSMTHFCKFNLKYICVVNAALGEVRVKVAYFHHWNLK